MKRLRVPKYLYIENRAVKYALFALFAAIVVDGLLTRFLVTGGFGSETNPLLQSLVATEAFLPLKISGGFLATAFLWIKYNAAPKRVHTVIVIALAFYTAIVYWNLSAYLFVLFTQPI